MDAGTGTWMCTDPGRSFNEATGRTPWMLPMAGGGSAEKSSSCFNEATGRTPWMRGEMSVAWLRDVALQ